MYMCICFNPGILLVVKRRLCFSISASADFHHSSHGTSPIAVEVPISPDLHPPPIPCISSTTNNIESFTSTMPDNSVAVEVPVVIETRNPAPTLKSEKSSCSPFEIRSLDGSPPQRRSPSGKSHSLSPAEQIPCMNNSLIDGSNLCDGDVNVGFSKEKLIEKGAIPKIRTNTAHTNQVHVLNNGFTSNGGTNLDNCDSDIDSAQGAPGSPSHVVQLAAKKLEDVIQLHQCREDGSLIVGHVSHSVSSEVPRDTGKPCQDLKFIDDETEENRSTQFEGKSSVLSSDDWVSARDVMSSSQMLADLNLSQQTASTSVAVQRPYIDTSKKRIYLSSPPIKQSKGSRFKSLNCRSAGDSMESVNDELDASYCISDKNDPYCSNQGSIDSSIPNSPCMGDCNSQLRRGSVGPTNTSTCTPAPDIQIQSISVPTSPVRKVVRPDIKKAQSKQDISITKHKAQSPLFIRKKKSYKAVDSSDEDLALSSEDVTTCENYKNLETFQKAQLNRKVKKSNLYIKHYTA